MPALPVAPVAGGATLVNDPVPAPDQVATVQLVVAESNPPLVSRLFTSAAFAPTVTGAAPLVTSTSVEFDQTDSPELLNKFSLSGPVESTMPPTAVVNPPLACNRKSSPLVSVET